MENLWIRIETWLQTHAPLVGETLKPGASEEQIRALETNLSITLPEDVKQSYRIHNGQETGHYGLIDGQEFLSLDRIQEEWQIWNELLEDGTFQDEDNQDQGCDPDPGVRNVWWHPRWIPLTYDGSGNHDCLDLDPAEGGVIGQIITMWHDMPERKIIAPSFRAWLTQYAESLESGQSIFSEEESEEE